MPRWIQASLTSSQTNKLSSLKKRFRKFATERLLECFIRAYAFQSRSPPLLPPLLSDTSALHPLQSVVLSQVWNVRPTCSLLGLCLTLSFSGSVNSVITSEFSASALFCLQNPVSLESSRISMVLIDFLLLFFMNL